MTSIIRSSLPGFESMTAADAIRATAGYGLLGINFSGLAEISPSLDPGELGAMKALADDLGVAIGSSVEFLNPMTERGRLNAAFGGGDLVAGLSRLLTLGAGIGIRDMFFMVGKIEDRFDPVTPWRTQLAATAKTLTALAPLMRDLGVRLLLKTHEEITTFEIIELVDAVGEDVLGVALDPVNLLCRIEEPVAATRRVAPLVALVHLDDAVLRFEEGGMRRYLCPIGEGAIDWQAILPLVPDARRVLEFHSGQFAMPVFDRAWRGAQPQMTLDEYADVLRFAAALPQDFTIGDQSHSTGRLPSGLAALATLPQFSTLSGRTGHADATAG